MEQSDAAVMAAFEKLVTGRHAECIGHLDALPFQGLLKAKRDLERLHGLIRAQIRHRDDGGH